jgi:hypothetical protein
MPCERVDDIAMYRLGNVFVVQRRGIGTGHFSHTVTV